MSAWEIGDPDPFASFIDRITYAAGQAAHAARVTDDEPSDEEVKAEFLRLLGDREVLAQEIQAEIGRNDPYSDSNETWKGILSTLDHLFGEEE